MLETFFISTGAVALAGSRLPVGVETELTGDPGRPDLDGHAAVLAVPGGVLDGCGRTQQIGRAHV